MGYNYKLTAGGYLSVLRWKNPFIYSGANEETIVNLYLTC